MRSRWRALLGSAGLLVGVAISVFYAYSGFKPMMPYLLVAAVAAIAVSLTAPRDYGEVATPARSDLIAVGILAIVMAPIYWWRLYSMPWQISTDEITVMLTARRLLSIPNVDLFGVNAIFGFPPAVFVFVGRLANWIGGVDLYHSRLVHSTLGLSCVLLAYGFFRQFTEPFRAGTLAAILGVNHALFAISRMAMRENTGLFLELLTLWLLARGLQRRSKTEVFLAGASTGIAFYAYFPARIALVVVVALFFCIFVLNPSREMAKTAAGYAVIFLVGWGLLAAPVMIASRANTSLAFSYARQQFLIYPEGRKLEMDWTDEKTPEGAWKANIRNGLTMFNSRKHDQGYIYPNYNHGFVDPLTGVLLWMGVAVAGVRVMRKRKRLMSADESGAVALADLTALVGFFTIYLSCALFITKAPNYTRLLVILPFVAYLAGIAIWVVAEWLAAGSRSTRSAIVGATVCAIALWNVVIFSDFAEAGRRSGNDVGSTGRYVESRNNANGYTWVLAADEANPYYAWGEAWQWKDWAGFFAGPSQTMKVIPVAGLGSLDIPGNFTVFITNTAWQLAEPGFRLRHPLYDVSWLTPDSRLLAIDVRGTSSPAGN